MKEPSHQCRNQWTERCAGPRISQRGDPSLALGKKKKIQGQSAGPSRHGPRTGARTAQSPPFPQPLQTLELAGTR